MGCCGYLLWRPHLIWSFLLKVRPDEAAGERLHPLDFAHLESCMFDSLAQICTHDLGQRFWSWQEWNEAPGSR